MTGRMPRGRGKAPKVAIPKPEVPQAELLVLLDESERMLAEAGKLDSGTWFEHFAFGVLDRDKAFRLIYIHNQHHLRIISDIMAA